MGWGRPDASLVFVTLGKSLLFIDLDIWCAKRTEKNFDLLPIQLFMNTLERLGTDYSLFMRD